MTNHRTKPPAIRPIKDVRLPEHTLREYPNGARLIIVNEGIHDVFKLECIFDAGRFYEKEKLLSSTTLQMLKEGSSLFTAEQIAEQVDFYGASLYTPTNLDYSNITLYGLNTHFPDLIPLYRDVITKPAFPKEELTNFISERKQRLKVDLSKNNVVAYREITEAIYGSVHPYGYNSNHQLYDVIGRDGVMEHFERNYKAGNCTLVLSGKVSHSMIDNLEQEFISKLPSGKSSPLPFSIQPENEKNTFTPKDSVQTAIRIGNRIFDKKHPDFFGMYFLNIILGDYFSSRLMMNIREDKGYTYSIYSMLDMMKKDGLFMIATETTSEHREALISEIRQEFDKLKTEPIPSEELEMARNYTLGTLLAALDGPFNSSEIIKSIYLDDVGENHFYRLVETIKSIDKEELANLARKYLELDNMFTVMVGGNV